VTLADGDFVAAEDFINAKTFFYGAVTLLLGYLERILDALHRVHRFGAAVQ